MQKLSSLPGVYIWGTGRAEKKGDTGRSRKSSAAEPEKEHESIQEESIPKRKQWSTVERSI